MAILFMDGWDHYGTAADVLLKWTSGTQLGTGISLGTGRPGSGQCLQMSNPSGQTHIKRSLHASNSFTTVVAGFWFKTDSFTNGDRSIIYFIDNGGGPDVQSGLHYNTSGQLVAARGPGTTNTLATSTPAMSLNTWHHLEMKFTVHNSTGLFQVKLDGTQVINFSGDTQHTANTAFHAIQLTSSNAGVMTKSFDDLFVVDTSGSLNNDFLGQCSVKALYPSGAGASTQWTPNSGTNHEAVDEVGQDGDTSYVAAATAGNKDLYAFGDLGATEDPLAVEVFAVTRKDDGTARTFATTMRSGSTDADGATYTQTTSYDYVEQYRDTDPDTSAAWTNAGVNALQAGVKVVS